VTILIKLTVVLFGRVSRGKGFIWWVGRRLRGIGRKEVWGLEKRVSKSVILHFLRRF